MTLKRRRALQLGGARWLLLCAIGNHAMAQEDIAALLNNMATSLFAHGRIITTEAKAKELRPFAERLITLARRGDLHARRQALSELRSQEIVHRLFAEVAPRMADRPGGYTRIIKIGPRQGDAADMVYLELVDYDPAAA